MLNFIWLGLVVAAVLLGGWQGCLDDVVKGGFDMARAAVMDIALPLSAIMTIWLGVMRLAEKSGLVLHLGRMLRPILRRLFPEVPADHPAMGSIVMNIAANMLGLGNAATPLGLRAMSELQKLNPYPGVATNAMCTFLAINTASVQLIPVTAIALLTIKGGKNPTAIVGTALLATLCAQITGLMAVKLFERMRIFRANPDTAPSVSTEAVAVQIANDEIPEVLMPPPRLSDWRLAVLGAFLLFFAFLFFSAVFPHGGADFSRSLSDRLSNTHGTFDTVVGVLSLVAMSVIKSLSLLAVPFFLSFFPLYAALRGIKVYEEFVDGAKEGFAVAVRIMPYLVAILAAVGMFRGAHGIDIIAAQLKPALDYFGFPPELLTLAFMRPLSGSGSIALVSDIITTYGPDHLYSQMAGTILGSTETTFYVLAVYFGSVGIRRTRHAVAAGLLADAVGIIASVKICQLMFH